MNKEENIDYINSIHDSYIKELQKQDEYIKQLQQQNKKCKEVIDKAIEKLYCCGEALQPDFQKQMLDILKEVE